MTVRMSLPTPLAYVWDSKSSPEAWYTSSQAAFRESVEILGRFFLVTVLYLFPWLRNHPCSYKNFTAAGCCHLYATPQSDPNTAGKSSIEVISTNTSSYRSIDIIIEISTSQSLDASAAHHWMGTAETWRSLSTIPITPTNDFPSRLICLEVETVSKFEPRLQ